MTTDSSNGGQMIKLNRKFSFKSIDERDEDELRSSVRSCSRSVTPKFLLSKQISIARMSSPMNIKPIFSRLEQKTLQPCNSQKEKTNQPDFRRQVENTQMFIVKKKAKDNKNINRVSQKRDSAAVQAQLGRSIRSPEQGKGELRIGLKESDRTRTKISTDSSITFQGGFNLFKIVKNENCPMKKLASIMSRSEDKATPIFIEVNQYKQLMQRNPNSVSPSKSILKNGSQFKYDMNKVRSIPELSAFGSPDKKVRFSRYMMFLKYSTDVE